MNYRDVLKRGMELAHGGDVWGGMSLLREGMAHAASASDSVWENRFARSVAILAESQGDTDESIACYRRMTVNQPTDMYSRIALGTALMATGRHAEAQAEFSVALELAEAAGDDEWSEIVRRTMSG